ncbi:MAG: multicopper oxidase domain-containing protein, partial [bacterium]
MRGKSAHARIFVAAVVFSSGILIATATPASASSCDVPTGGTASPLFGAGEFDQPFLRFEEFGTQKLGEPCSDCTMALPVPPDTRSAPDSLALDAFLAQELHPFPTRECNMEVSNPWQSVIETMTGPLVPLPGNDLSSYCDGRPPGEEYAHQRWDEFFPQKFFQTAQACSRPNLGLRDPLQMHGFSEETEWGPFGLYFRGVEDETGELQGSCAGIDIRFHPAMPVQEAPTLWTFDGTLPPKLLMARYGESILFRHHNTLPVEFSNNRGFGNHFISTHEHNGHNPAESDGYTQSFFLPGQFYDYHWPMVLAGHDSINTDATDPRASTPCEPLEVMLISKQGRQVPVTCPAEGYIKIPGDWRETMSTHWFHDHMLDYTAQNVYKGNAAMMNYYSALDRGNEAIDDGVNLRLPSGTHLSWGNRDYDLQVLVASKAWGQDTSDGKEGQLWFNIFNPDGFVGDRMTVNWLYKPFLDVRARRYRMRILNGDVSRFMRIAIVKENADGSYDRVPFHMIANDGNILEHAVPFDGSMDLDRDGELQDHNGILPTQAIAERYDIVVDFSRYQPGDKLYMVNVLEHKNGKRPHQAISLAEILAGEYDGCDSAVGKFMEIRVHEYADTDLSMDPADYVKGKKAMIPMPHFTEEEIANATHRTFRFGRSNGTDKAPWTIKADGGMGFGMDPHRVTASPSKGDVEIWHLSTGGGWSHNVHVHFEEGRILKRDGEDPPAWEEFSRKDIYRIGRMDDSGSDIDFIIRFREFSGSYMEHCHNTQHEDHAMLMRWDIDSGDLKPMLTPMPDWNGCGYDESTFIPTAYTGDTTAAADFFKDSSAGDFEDIDDPDEEDMPNPIAPTTTLPAPTTTVPAPTTTVPAPTTTLPAPTTTVPAPTTTVPAPTTTVPAPTTTVPAPTTTVPAPTTTVPAPTTTVPAPTTTVPAPTTTVPAPTTTV